MNVTHPKRVLYVITKANWGGAQKYVFDLAVGMKARGHIVSVVYGEPGILVDRLLDAGISSMQVPAMGRDVHMGSDVNAYRSLYSLFNTESPDVVHLNSSKAGILGAIAAHRANVRTIIFTSHGWAFNEDRPFWQKYILYGIYALLIYLSNSTICVSEAVKRDISWIPGTKRKLVVIHNGIQESAYLGKESARKELLPGVTGGIWIGMLAELHPTKRIEDAISAMHILIPHHPNLHLFVLGEGQQRAVLEKMVSKYGLAGNVHLVGFIPNAPTLLHAFDYFLLCSRSESLGYAALEAGLAQIPMIVTNVGGLPEIVTHMKSGLLVPAYAPQAIADAITYYIDHPETAERFSTELIRHIRATFSVDDAIKKTAATYSL